MRSLLRANCLLLALPAPGLPSWLQERAPADTSFTDHPDQLIDKFSKKTRDVEGKIIYNYTAAFRNIEELRNYKNHTPHTQPVVFRFGYNF